MSESSGARADGRADGPADVPPTATPAAAPDPPRAAPDRASIEASPPTLPWPARRGDPPWSGPPIVQPDPLPWREFARRRDGMMHAMDGGLWLHRHVWKGTPMAHLVSTDREALLAYGRVVGLPAARLQYKPLRDPRTGDRREAWHWDLVGRFLPTPRDGD